MARYRILPQRSRLAAEARSTLHPIRFDSAGLEGWFDAEVRDDHLDPDVKPNAHIELAATLLKTGNRLYDSEIDRKVEARKFPRIIGRVHAFAQVGDDNRYMIASDLRFHGVTRPVSTEVTVRIGDKELEVEGEYVFDVRDFGLEPPKLLMLQVYPDVRVHCLVVAAREE